MRFVHALSLDGLDGGQPYWRMTCLSAASARAWNPSSESILLIDVRSREVLAAGGANEEVTANFHTVRVVDAPEEGALLRSRFLKTGMRDFVEGDFLFLDSDTVVCGDLSGLEAMPADLCAVSDQNRGGAQLSEVEESVYAACGWRRPSRYNINSGVLYWRDTPAAHALGALWREKWTQSRTATGRHNDQQALNSAIEDSLDRIVIEQLPSGYNAQVGLRPETAFDARVWHIFSTDRKRVPHMETVFEPFWDGKAELNKAHPSFFRPHPFRVRDGLDAVVIGLLRHRPATAGNLRFNDWRRLWLAGDRRESARALVREARTAVGRGMRQVTGSRPALSGQGK